MFTLGKSLQHRPKPVRSIVITLRQGSTPTIKITDSVAFSTHGLPIMHIFT